MHLSCLPVSLYPEFTAGRMSLGDWFRQAAALGLDGADISVAHVPDRTLATLDGLRGAAHAAGIPIVMIATYTDFTHPDASERQRQVDDLRRWIEAAARLEARFLRLTAGQDHPATPQDDGLDWAVAGLTACLAEARAAGVQLLYENHVRGAVWSANDFTQPAARYLHVVRQTEASPLGLLFDTANPLALSDDPIRLLEQVKARVQAVHLSDIRRAGSFEPVLIGSGVAPIVELLRILVQHGFDSWISIEEASKTGRTGFAHAIAAADAAWVAAGGQARTLRG